MHSDKQVGNEFELSPQYTIRIIFSATWLSSLVTLVSLHPKTRTQLTLESMSISGNPLAGNSPGFTEEMGALAR